MWLLRCCCPGPPPSPLGQSPSGTKSPCAEEGRGLFEGRTFCCSAVCVGGGGVRGMVTAVARLQVQRAASGAAALLPMCQQSCACCRKDKAAPWRAPMVCRHHPPPNARCTPALAAGRPPLGPPAVRPQALPKGAAAPSCRCRWRGRRRATAPRRRPPRCRRRWPRWAAGAADSAPCAAGAPPSRPHWPALLPTWPTGPPLPSAAPPAAGGGAAAQTRPPLPPAAPPRRRPQ